jgi:hypothetical protein
MQNRIFSIDNAKASKAVVMGYLNAIHYMAPHEVAGVGNMCAYASPGCKELCLAMYSGHAAIIAKGLTTNSVRESRIQKTRRFMRYRDEYMMDVVKSIHKVGIQASNLNLKPVIRMGGGDDIAWDRIRVSFPSGVYQSSLMDVFPHMQFMDYTKNLNKLRRKLPANYHLTFSRSERNKAECLEALRLGFNVAVVFRNKPQTYWGYPVIDGDLHDLRFLDPKGVIVGLSPKGAKAKADTSGFVI